MKEAVIHPVAVRGDPIMTPRVMQQRTQVTIMLRPLLTIRLGL
jgi:hypothetical protein